MWWNNWERSRPACDAQDSSCYCHTTWRAFMRVMGDFRDFFLVQGNRIQLELTAKGMSGHRLSLGIPFNWYLEVRSADELPELADHITDDLLCCRESITPIGRCVVEMPGGTFVRTGIVLMMGYRTRVYAYDTKSECLVMAGYHLDDLARFGLIMCECIYRVPQTPYSTRHPRQIVHGLLFRSGDAWALAAFAAAHAGKDINLHTPGRRARPLRLVAGFMGLSELWPFAALSDSSMRRCRRALTLRFCCSWYVIGATGTYRSSGFFHTNHVIIVDRFAAVYTLEIRSGDCYRIADNMHEFFKGGLTKTVVLRRYDHALRSAARLERVPRCHHVPYEVLRPPHTVYAACVSHEYYGQYAWLCRPGRFKEGMMCTWDRDDSFAERDLRARAAALAGVAIGAAQEDGDGADVVAEALGEGADNPHDGQLPPPRRWARGNLAPVDGAGDPIRVRIHNAHEEDMGLDLAEDAASADVSEHVHRRRLADRLVAAYDSEETVSQSEVESRRVLCWTAVGDLSAQAVFSFRQYIT